MRELPSNGSEIWKTLGMKSMNELSRRAILGGLTAFPFLPGAALARNPSRILSIGGSVTETLYFLDCEGRIVGTDTTSHYPPAAERLPKIGYMRNISAEGVLSLSPSLMIADAGAGPPAAIEKLKAAGLDIATAPEARDIAGVVEKIEAIADFVGERVRGTRLADEVRARGDRVSQHVATLDRKPTVLFLMDARDGALLSAGRNTAASAIIELGGGKPVFEDFQGYKPISTESVLAAQPDAILMMDHVAHRLGGHQAVARLPQLSGLRAAHEGRVHTMPGLLLLGFGPRTPDAAARLADMLHETEISRGLAPPLEAS